MLGSQGARFLRCLFLDVFPSLGGERKRMIAAGLV